MQFDTELFKPWVGNLGLKDGWNSVTISQMEEFYQRKAAQGFQMAFVESTVRACQEFMEAIEPALIEHGPEEDSIISVVVEGGVVTYVNGPQFKRREDNIVLQVGLSKYAAEIDDKGNVTVGNLSGVAVVTPIVDKDKNPKLDDNGNPRFKASVRLMDFDNEDSETFEIWFAFQKNLKDANGKLVVLSEPKLNSALRKGKFFNFLSHANEAGASSGEDAVWIDMRMLPKGNYKINKIVGPKAKTYEDPLTKTKTTVNKWYLEIDSIGMAQSHSALMSSLESMGEYYQKLAEMGELGLAVTEHIVDYESTAGGPRKKVEYFPDFFQAHKDGDVVPVKRGIAGPERKHYMTMAFVEGLKFQPNPILGGIVNQALAIEVKPEKATLSPGTEQKAIPAAVTTVEAEVVNLSDEIPF